MKLTRKNDSTLKRKSGQGMTEYIIIIAIVAIGAIVIVGVFGKTIKATFSRIARALTGENKASAAPEDGDADSFDNMGDFTEEVDQS